MDGTTILVKSLRKYGKNDHSFCANKGFAPKLLGLKGLPGGWFGIEYLPSASAVFDSPLVYKMRSIWIQTMKFILKLSRSSMTTITSMVLTSLSIKSDCCWLTLVDFGWGGECGKTTFPDTRFHPIRRNNRQEILITKGHDQKVLADTI